MYRFTRFTMALCLVVLWTGTSLAAAAAPQVRQTGADLNAFVPQGWSVGESGTGDLNRDGRPDIAAVLSAGENSYHLLLLLAVDLAYGSKGYVATAVTDISAVFGEVMNCGVVVENGAVSLAILNGANESTYTFSLEGSKPDRTGITWQWRLVGHRQYSNFGPNEQYLLAYDLLTGHIEEEDSVSEPGSVNKSARTAKCPPIYLGLLKNADDLSARLNLGAADDTAAAEATGVAAAVPAELKTYTNSIGMEFVLIPAGSFSAPARVTGSPHIFKEDALVRASVSKPFYLGKYEVTQEQWVAVTGKNPASPKGRTNPVNWVSWFDVYDFIQRLNAKEGHSRYRLPTEMEWELAARGGTDTLFFFMEDPETWGEAASALEDYAWCGKNAGGTIHPVGRKKPNQYGLYDVYGNVDEWVQDGWADILPTDRELRDYQYRNPASSKSYKDLYDEAIESGIPTDSTAMGPHVLRGGMWDYPDRCRSGYRRMGGDAKAASTGFRLAISPEE